MVITFEVTDDKEHVTIIKDGKKVGHIFSPSGSGGLYTNAIQVCGFSEAYDLWGCGVFEGFKDIQLLFDDKKMEGKFSASMRGCMCCYMEPCQCDNKSKTSDENWLEENIIYDSSTYVPGVGFKPFNLKTSNELHKEKRLLMKEEEKCDDKKKIV